MSDSTQLQAARELTEVLEQMEATASLLGTLQGRKDELIAILSGGEKIVAKASEAAPEKPQEVTPSEPDEPEVVDPKLEALSAMPNNTQAEKDAKLKAAEDLSLEYVEKASAPQKKMIFAMLGSHGIKSEAELKAVIFGIVAKLHHGVKLESVSKELSKAWATDLIDYIKKHDTADLMTFVKEPF